MFAGSRLFFLFFSFCCCCYALPSAYAIPADEVLVVANKRVAGSVSLARYYMQKRNIPQQNLLILVTSAQETIDRQEYDRWIRKPVAKKIARLNKIKKKRGELNISTIVTIYGVPLKIREGVRVTKRKKHGLDTTKAAVDSELALVLVNGYPVAGWIANPHFLPRLGEKNRLAKNSVLLVSRLDAPTVQIVRRMIDDALAVENDRLQGIGYFDARGMVQNDQDAQARLQGYKRYDLSLLRAAEQVEKKMAVVLDNKPELFAENSCPAAALYCGWYSYGRYIDSFAWKKGAIGYHIASAECASLHQKGGRYWCPQMLARGAAATVGPVYEPYVNGFPLPEIFFAMLMEGMSVGEAYLLSLPYISWQMVLLADPLYQPFS